MKLVAYKKTLKIALLKISKLVGMFYLTRILSKRKLLILCYHGFQLMDEAGFRPRLFMRGEVFAKRLDIIRRQGFPVLPLDEATRRLRDGTLPDNAVCLTIDDGFYSVLACAAPLLRKHSFPAMLYVTSYYVANSAPIFRLAMQYMFWKTESPALDVSDQQWGLRSAVNLVDPETKDSAMWSIIEFGETRCNEVERHRISTVIGDRLQVDYQAVSDSRIVSLLTPEEIKQINDMGIEVQLHTHRHRLPLDDEKEARKEVTENASFLEGILERPLRHLCYPSGVWNSRQWPWLKALGIQSATTCNPGLNTADTSVLGLYRVVDDDNVSQVEFEAELSGFSELIRQITGRRRKFELARRSFSEPTVMHTKESGL